MTINEYTSEYVYNTIKLNDTRNIVENTILECKYGATPNRNVKVKCTAEFLDKINNETKVSTITSCNIIGNLNKIMQSSKGMNDFIRVIQLKTIIQGRFYKNCLITYLRSSIIPILWKKHYLKMTHDEGYKHNQLCR